MGILIGHRDRIAVEFELNAADSEEVRKWLFGRMCLWAGGQRIGRYDEGCAMTVAMASFPLILQRKSRRSDATLMRMPAAPAFATIHNALHGDADPPEGEDAIEGRFYARFEVLDRGFDVFDGWSAYLIEDRIVGRLIWRAPDQHIHEARLGAGEFDRVLEQFLTALERATGYTRGHTGA
jgi:hypothetical protein